MSDQLTDEEIAEELDALFEKCSVLVSRYCNNCNDVWFYPPDKPTDCPWCTLNRS